MSDRSVSFYLNRAKSLTLNDPSNVKKISILSNFTLQGLGEVLKVFSNEQKMDIEVYESLYNQFNQQIFNTESDWHNFKPELTFIILDFDSLIGDARFEFYNWNDQRRRELVEQTCNDVKNLLHTALKTQKGKIVISNFVIPNFSPFGIIDSKVKYSMRDFVNSLNMLVKELSYENQSLYCLELDSFFQYHGRLNITDEKLRFLADMKISPSFLPAFAEILMGFIKPLFGRTKKCLVLDLDNTLWGGIIGEDGINNILLDDKSPGNTYLEFQKVVLELYHRGIILAINSKNNPDDVKEVFEKHPNMILKENHFASMRINWDNKITNLVSIAEELNIGLDSIVFWDDDPMNRELIKQRLPEVLVVDVPRDPSLYANTLRSLNDFNTFQITEEDRQKGKMYAAQHQRKQIEKQFSNIDDFLSMLEMEVTAKKAENFTIPRISQLTMKTNQFNTTTRRYTEEEIKRMVNDPHYLIKTFSVSDKFGDNGLTGLYIIKKNNQKNWTIDTFLMSCRIMGRNIEKVMLSDVVEEAKKENVEELIGEYISTKKNDVSKNLYSNYGFSRINDSQFLLDLTLFPNSSIPYVKIKQQEN